MVVIGLGVVAVAAVGSGVALWAKNRKQQPTIDVKAPECVSNYNASMAAYLKAIWGGSLDPDLIARLISDLDALKENADSGTISLELSVQDSEQLVRLIAGYTSKLADANAVDVGDLEAVESDSPDAAIIDMRRYLELQKKIFAESA
ncbi:hypothetical protein [Janibacter sp. G368]|uniref:hypothetical protein n=1 Tax=Janibacter sp. G368 TaxID=3420441 RepID=UPI003D067B8D